MSYVPPKRSARPTEKGRLWQLDENQGKRSKIERKLRNKMKSIQEAIDAENEELARAEMAATDLLFKDFMELHAKCMMLMNEDAELLLSESFADRVDRDVHKLKRKFYDFINQHPEPQYAGDETSNKSLERSKTPSEVS
eukprot:TCONS_00034298-protein